MTAEQRRADLAVLRDECQSLRMKVLDMEEDARVSPSPRKGGMCLMNGDSPFSSMKAYSRFVEDDAKQANDPDATALSISADTPMRSPAMIPAEGGSMQALALTPPASDNVEEEKKAAASVKKLAVSLRSKAEMLLAASSGASVAIEGSSSVAGLNQHDHLTHSVSELVQTEAWLDQVIATTDRIRHENQTSRKLSRRRGRWPRMPLRPRKRLAPTLKEQTIDASPLRPAQRRPSLVRMSSRARR